MVKLTINTTNYLFHLCLKRELLGRKLVRDHPVQNITLESVKAQLKNERLRNEEKNVDSIVV